LRPYFNKSMKKTTAKTTAKAPAKKAAAKTPAKKATAAKATPAKTAAKKTKSDKPTTLNKLNKLELAYAEKQLSRAEYDMWKTVYQKEVPFNANIIEEDNYRPRKTRRRAW